MKSFLSLLFSETDRLVGKNILPVMLMRKGWGRRMEKTPGPQRLLKVRMTDQNNPRINKEKLSEKLISSIFFDCMGFYTP